MVNLALKEREWVTMGGKGRDEIRSEVGKDTGKVEILLVGSELDMDKSGEA